MPRRARTRDYEYDEADSDMYDMERERERERDPYRRASRPERSHHHEKVHRDYARRHSIPPPLEKMERLRVQDRDFSPPRPNEYFREDFDMDSRRFAPRLSDDEADADIPPDEPLRGFDRRHSPPSRGSGSGSGRRRRPPPPRVVVPEEEVLPRSASDGRLVDSDSDAEVYHRRRRSESIRSHNEVPPRHRRPRKVDLDDRGDVYSGEEAISSDYRRPRGGSHRYRGSAPRPRAGYHTDAGEESSDAMFRKPRRKMDHVRPGFVPADRDDLSSPESEDSADLPTAPVPPMHPGPGRGQRLRVPEAFSPLRPPRAPSPEVSFEAPRLKLRKDRDERKREIPIDPQDIDPRDIDPRGIDPRDIDPRDLDPRVPMDVPPPMRAPSPEPPGWRMKDPIPPPRSRAHSLDKNIGPETMIREIRPDGSSVIQGEEILEDVRDEHPLADPMPRDLMSRDAADRWAIVNAVPKSKSSTRDSTPSQEAPHSRPRERKTKFTAGEERPSDDDANFDRARVARRYVGMKKKERLWTEITKDLVVKEAIERAGYEYEETVSSYFVFSYLQYEDVSALVELSEDIRLARRRRIQELDRRRASVPSPRSLHDEPVMRPPSPRRRHRDGRRTRERDFFDDSRERARSGRR